MIYLGKFDPLKDECVRVMDKDGNIINPKLMPKISPEEVLEAYKIMNLSRRQDIYQNTMQRQGRLLSFLSSTGQEACNELGAKSPDGVNSLPPNIVIGSQYSQATGIAFAEKYRKSGGVVVTTTGDGGTSEGETYEAMNFAKLHEVPVVFVFKAIATGTPSIKVDGNDYLACIGVFKEVVEYVRNGNGPVFVECETYRLGAHSSSDNPDVYRPKDKQQEELDAEHDKLVAAEFA
ncbi:hypothetical protein HZH68_017154 [Vespula germanica]|uniref:2-oxoisovalerate dehydrogenase subunit alpha n=1 Tax=Vespula germanica TaxID=30212 RepID=A0A834MMM5_VESGE|nr:hypothetical protein HZH68_017154 [Vespula germanica]